ncbi:HAD family hydrolase [Roseococcus sp.]|uniref:HAD family hydrolase n=1 Tax=Roseococcus sp. TaxID=2109646 RepID=UPI003BA8F777
MIPTPLDAVVFDMDGLLLDTEALYRTAIFAACASQGHAMVDHVHLSLIGAPEEVGDAKLMGHFGAGFDLGLYHATSAAHFDALCGLGAPLRPGAREIVAFLKSQGVPLGVATSTARGRAEARLAKAGLLEALDVLVTRSDVTQGKPHPESYLKAAAALGARPSHCLALEDSHNGVRSAAAAGMATIMIPDLLPATEEIAALCAGVLPSLLDVLEALRSQICS